MKKALLLLAAAAMVASSTAALAQPRGGPGNRNDNRYDNRSDYRDGRDGRDGHRYSNQYRQGQRLDNRYRNGRYEVNDWQRYRLSAPPRGYRYYRDDNGNVVLAAIATGIIAFALADIFGNNNNNNNSYGRYDNGYDDRYYGNPGYGGAYGGGQVWYDRNGRPYTVDRNGRSVWLR